MFEFLKYNLDTKMKLDGISVMVGDVIARSNKDSIEDAYYIVKIISNQRKEFINCKNTFSGSKDIFNYVVVNAIREISKFTNEVEYKVVDNKMSISLYDFLKKPNLRIIDSVIMLTIR